MGIVNVTPDSFSGDGLAGDIAGVVDVARSHESAGAEILDVGGESTRPGFTAVDAEVELRRVIPAIEGIRNSGIRVPISVDTSKAEVARQALEAGAAIVNDISGLQDPAMTGVVADFGAGVVIMHSRRERRHSDVLDDVLDFLDSAVSNALSAGVDRSSIVVDPGFGFAKVPEENLRLIREFDRIRALGFPTLLGTSRKMTIGRLLDLPVDQRVEGTIATAVLAIARGVDIIRVHDVEAVVRAAKVADAIVRGS